ncbi:MAG: hypothetical protein AAF662_10785 [Pseudomonadota bacterium]
MKLQAEPLAGAGIISGRYRGNFLESTFSSSATGTLDSIAFDGC